MNAWKTLNSFKVYVQKISGGSENGRTHENYIK